MPLPEIPISLWTDWQSRLFGEKADQLESAQTFREAADQAIGMIPPDALSYDWEAEARRLEEEQQRRYEEEARAQAARDQEVYRQQAEERAAAERQQQLARLAPPMDPTPFGVDAPVDPDQGPREAGYSLPP